MTNFSTQEAGSSESEVSLAYTASSTTARGQGNKKGDLVLKKKKHKNNTTTKDNKSFYNKKKKKLAETNALENTFLDNKM